MRGARDIYGGSLRSFVILSKDMINIPKIPIFVFLLAEEIGMSDGVEVSEGEQQL